MEKFKDGLMLSAFINQHSGFSKVINVEKLNLVTEDEETGGWRALTMHQCAVNQYLMLQAARYMGVNLQNVSVMKLLEPRKNRAVVLKLIREVIMFEGNDNSSKIFIPHNEEVYVVKNVKQVHQFAHEEEEKEQQMFKQFLNDLLSQMGINDKVDPNMSLAESLSDCKMYVQVLNFLRADSISLSVLKEEDVLERAALLAEALHKLNLILEYQNYDIAFGDDHVHLHIVASIATLASSSLQEMISS